METIIKYLICVLFVIFSLNAYGNPQSRLPGTYSSLKINVEGGDLLGYEVRIIPIKKGYKAVVQVSEGGIGNVFLVDVEIKNEEVLFDVPIDTDYVGKFIGKVTDDGLVGVVTYPSGYIVKIELKRTVSYWERKL